jgi:hypothetical protein
MYPIKGDCLWLRSHKNFELIGIQERENRLALCEERHLGNSIKSQDTVHVQVICLEMIVHTPLPSLSSFPVLEGPFRDHLPSHIFS